MTQNSVFNSVAGAATVRTDHPDQLKEQITTAFYDAADAVARLREQLGHLADHLESRFSSEERNGWFEDVLCHAPWLTPQAQQLQEQHVPLIETVRGLQRRCDDQASPVAWWDGMRRAFDEFWESLQEHEQANQRLLREVNPGLDWTDEDQ